MCSFVEHNELSNCVWIYISREWGGNNPRISPLA